MQTSITLTAKSTYKLNLIGLGVAGDLTEFAWAHVVGLAGSATIKIIDRRQPVGQPDTLQLDMAIPGIVTVPVRKSIYPLASEVEITAGSNGFKGEIHLEMQQTATLRGV